LKPSQPKLNLLYQIKPLNINQLTTKHLNIKLNTSQLPRQSNTSQLSTSLNTKMMDGLLCLPQRKEKEN